MLLSYIFRFYNSRSCVPLEQHPSDECELKKIFQLITHRQRANIVKNPSGQGIVLCGCKHEFVQLYTRTDAHSDSTPRQTEEKCRSTKRR